MKCPKCDRPVASQTVKCPHCGNSLKAFGHPGIPLYQAEKGTYLCDRCYYHHDDTCNYPQRPYAKTCTMFHDASQPLTAEDTAYDSPGGITGFKLWCDRNRGLLILMGIIAFSVVLVVV